jgi:hypothetical protein
MFVDIRAKLALLTQQFQTLLDERARPPGEWPGAEPHFNNPNQRIPGGGSSSPDDSCSRKGITLKADFVQALQAHFSPSEKVEELEEIQDEEEEQGDNHTVIPVPADGAKRTTNPATEPTEDPQHFNSEFLNFRMSEFLKEQQILDRSGELDVVVWKHKWQWNNVEINAEVELSQETEPLKGSVELPSCSIRGANYGLACGGFSKSKPHSRGCTTEASRCRRVQWERTGGPPRRVDLPCPSLGRRRGSRWQSSAGRGRRAEQHTDCLKGRVSWLGTRMRPSGWPTSKGWKKERRGWKSRRSVDKVERWKKNLELGKGILQRSTKRMALYIGANQLATNNPMVHRAWKKRCVLFDRVCHFKGEVTIPVLYKQC